MNGLYSESFIFIIPEHFILLSQILILVISIILGIKIVNNKKIKNYWAFLTPVLITLAIIFIDNVAQEIYYGIPNNMNIVGGLYFIFGMLVFGINAIIMGAYLKFVKKRLYRNPLTISFIDNSSKRPLIKEK